MWSSSLVRALVLACVMLASPWSSVARAGSDQSLVVGDVTLRVRAPWPDMVTHGAVPLLFDAVNRGADGTTVRLTLTARGWAASETLVTRSFELAPGATTSFELFAPAEARMASQYSLRAEASSGDVQVLGNVGSMLQPQPLRRNVLVLVARAPTTGEPARWTTALSTESEPRNSTLSCSCPTYVVPTAPGAAPSAIEHVVATAVVHEDLPTRPEGYASIDAVVIDARDGWPRPERAGPIAEWVRTGGIVLVSGRGAEAVARASADFGPWIEERFLIVRRGGVSTYACAQGFVLVGTGEEPLADADEIAALNAEIEGAGTNAGRVSWIPQCLADRAEFESPSLGAMDLPYRTLMLLLLLFGLLVGPLNIWFVRRAKKPALLLVTVPALSLLFSLGLFVYGALAQGLDARVARATFTLLDQRSHRSSTAEVRQFFVGLASADGLRPGPGASVWSEPASDVIPLARSGAGTLDFGSTLTLSGGYLPVRTPTRQTVLVDRASRVRLDVRREGAGWVVQNGLGTRIESLLVRVADGETWRALAIEPGGRATLEPASDASLDEVTESVLPRAPADARAGLPLATYAAWLAACPFGDDLGVEMREVEGRHALVGVLDPEEVR